MKTVGLVVVLILVVFPFYHFAAPGQMVGYETLKLNLRAILVIYIIANLKHTDFLGWKTYTSWFAYALYLALATISILYSSDRGYSAEKLLDLGAISLVSVILVGKNVSSTDDLFRLINFILVIYILGMFIVGFTFYGNLYRYMGYQGVARLGGYIINPNLLGHSCVIVAIVNIYFLSNINTPKNPIIFGRVIPLTIIMAVLYILLETRSRSAIGIGIAVLPLFTLMVQKRSMAKYIWLNYVIVLVVIAVPFSSELLNFYSRGSLQSLNSLTGRVDIWSELSGTIKFDLYFFLGHGFQMLSPEGLGLTLSSFSGHELTMAHNNILQVYLGLGFAGLLLVFYLSIRIINEMASLRKHERKELLVVAVIMLDLFAFSMVEFGVFGPNNILIVVFVMIVFYLSHCKSRVYR